MANALTTCDVCEYTWDAATWTRCPRCMGTHKAYEPTKSEIQEACAVIQQTWSPREENSRRAPAYRLDGLEVTEVIKPSTGLVERREYLD